MIFKLICKPGETEQEARERFAEVYFHDDIGFLGIFIKLMEAQTQAGKRCGECFAAKKPAAVLFYHRLYDPDPGQPKRDPSYNPVLSLALCPEHDINEICALLCNDWGRFCDGVKHDKITCLFELELDYAEPLFIITINSDDYKNYERCFVELKNCIRWVLADYFEAQGCNRADTALEISEFNNFHIEEPHTEAEVKALIEHITNDKEGE